MAGGVLRVCLNQKQLKKSALLDRIWSRSISKSWPHYKEATKEAEVKGIPYSKLTIGVPKEIWQNEKR